MSRRQRDATRRQAIGAASSYPSAFYDELLEGWRSIELQVINREEILTAYPDLEKDDISEALRFAAEAVRERELPRTGT